MNKVLQLLNIKQEERQLVFLMLGFSFCVGLANSFLKTIADASFIIHFGIVKVPEAIIIGGLLGYMINSLLGILYKKWGFGNVTTLMSLCASVIISTFCLFLIFGESIMSPIYWLFIVSMPLSIIIENAFNGTILRYLNYEQNKRLSGLLISGMVFSGIIGCFLIPFLKSVLPKPETLLLFSAIGCTLSLFLFLFIRKKVSISESTVTEKNTPSKIKLPTKSRYFWLMTIFIFIAAGLFYIINFGFLYLLGDIKKNYNAGLVITLIAIMNGIIKLSEFTLSLFSGKILSKKGVAFGLSAMPLALLIFIFLAFIFTEAHQFWIFFGCIVMTKYVERVLRKGLTRPSQNVLYQLFEDKKSRVQHFLDGNVASISAIFFGVMLYILVKFVHDDLTIPFSFFTTLVVGFWFILSIAIAVQYRKELYQKLKSIVPQKIEKLSDLLIDRKQESKVLNVNGTFHVALYKPLLLIEDIDVKQEQTTYSKEELKTNASIEIEYDKLIYLLITHYRLEQNPFYEEMSRYFENEIRDEICNIGNELDKKFNQNRLFDTLKIVYDSDDKDEKLYAFELLTATVSVKDKKQLQIIYNLINSSELEKSLLYHIQGEKIGLRKIMKSIISEKEFRFSPLLRASAIHVLGQNYILRVPKEIIEATYSPNDLVKEMAEKVIEFDKSYSIENEEISTLKTGYKWNIIEAMSKSKILCNLGNESLNQLYYLAEKNGNFNNETDNVYLLINGWVNIDIRGNIVIDNLGEDLLELSSIYKLDKASSTILLNWSTCQFKNIIKL